MLSSTMPLKSSMGLQAVLDPVPLLGPLGVVPLVQGAHQVAGATADPLKANALAQLFVLRFYSLGLFPPFLG